MSDLPKVSVVIPTRNRPDTLAKALLTATNQTYRNLEIIVSNNGGDPETARAVAAVGDPRVKCVDPGRPVSMSHNFEFAMSHVTGEWIVLIGDDDGILPSGIERALKVMEASGGEAMSSLACRFIWPSPDGNDRGVSLSVPMGSGWSWRSSEAAIGKIMRREMGFQDAPMTYSGGMMKTSLYNQIRDVRGTFYQSQIPDCFSAFAFLSVTDRYVFCREPFMIAGTSRHSNGMNAMQLKKIPFASDDNIPFHSDLPLPSTGTFTFSFQALLYESYLQTQYLRSSSPLIDIEEQATIILAYAKEYRHRTIGEGGERGWEVAQEWGRLAADAHGLDYNSLLRRAETFPKSVKLAEMRVYAHDFATRYVVDTRMNLPIADVYQASIVAETIRRTKPNRLGSFRRSIARRFG